MQRTMVRYRVKPECAAENKALVEGVYAELHQTKPAGLHYATFRSSDGVSHVHIATIEGENPLMKSAAFAAFQKDLPSRVEEPPTFMELEEIGSYQFFAE